MKEKTHYCELCGSPVRIISSEEGTIYYEPRRIAMLFNVDYVKSVCTDIAPKYKLDPALMVAIAKTECKHVSPNMLDSSVARLEQRFYEKYVEEKLDLATTVEVKLACSWGVWQIMGYELYKLGLFDEHFERTVGTWRDVLRHPLSPICVTEALDEFCVVLSQQCRYACMLMRQKIEQAKSLQSFKGVTDKLDIALLLWNGGSNLDYPSKVRGYFT